MANPLQYLPGKPRDSISPDRLHPWGPPVPAAIRAGLGGDTEPDRGPERRGWCRRTRSNGPRASPPGAEIARDASRILGPVSGLTVPSTGGPPSGGGPRSLHFSPVTQKAPAPGGAAPRGAGPRAPSGRAGRTLATTQHSNCIPTPSRPHGL